MSFQKYSSALLKIIHKLVRLISNFFFVDSDENCSMTFSKKCFQEICQDYCKFKKLKIFAALHEFFSEIPLYFLLKLWAVEKFSRYSSNVPKETFLETLKNISLKIYFNLLLIVIKALDRKYCKYYTMGTARILPANASDWRSIKEFLTQPIVNILVLSVTLLEQLEIR